MLACMRILLFAEQDAWVCLLWVSTLWRSLVGGCACVVQRCLPGSEYGGHVSVYILFSEWECTVLRVVDMFQQVVVDSPPRW